MIDSKEFKKDKLVQYFTSKERVDVTDKNFEKAIKLDKMIALINNEEIDKLKKYYEMKQLFKSADKFEKEYSFLREFDYDDKVYYLLLYVDQITNYLRRIEEGLSKDIEKELLEYEKNQMLDDYPYAQYFVCKYIEYNDSPFFNDFLEYANITEPDFKRFVGIIFQLDDLLYEKYEEKAKLNRDLRIDTTLIKLTNINDGVTTGYTQDGEKFDAVSFYKNLPFIDLNGSSEILEDFDIKKTPSIDKRLQSLFMKEYAENVRKIMEYIYTNGLFSHSIKTVSEKSIMGMNFIINGVALSDEEKKLIIDYMKNNNIPLFLQAFCAVRNKYLEEGLSIDKDVLKK